MAVANAFASPDTFIIVKWNREIAKKNVILGTSVAYSPGGFNSVFELSGSDLQQTVGSTAYGDFEYDGNGDIMPASSGSADLYFELDGNSDIEPL